MPGNRQWLLVVGSTDCSYRRADDRNVAKDRQVSNFCFVARLNQSYINCLSSKSQLAFGLIGFRFDFLVESDCSHVVILNHGWLGCSNVLDKPRRTV